ncbi:helix-turn-helix domain-containing protein [Streptomyces anthocyanicus]|uniref:helix-turn-helix domain-containing protein n=1 Tax=Streptomyces anthocyanicus TaxID=68174 RepID=UPI00363C9328
MDKLLYRIPETAERLNFGQTKAKALIRSGELRSIKVGGIRLVPAEALAEFVRRLDAEQNGHTA